MIQIILKAMISFFVLISFSLAEEVGQNRVKGSVMNKSEGIPLQGANVQLKGNNDQKYGATTCLLYTSPSPRDGLLSRMPSSA